MPESMSVMMNIGVNELLFVLCEKQRERFRKRYQKLKVRRSVGAQRNMRTLTPFCYRANGLLIMVSYVRV